MDLEMESANAWMSEHYVAIRVSTKNYYILVLSILNVVYYEDVLENCAVLEDGEDGDFRLDLEEWVAFFFFFHVLHF